MAKYRWRVPELKAVQFDGKNNKEIKALIGDETDSEEPSIGTGKYEEPHKQEHKEEKKAEGAEPKAVTSEPPKEIRERLKLKPGDWVTVDLGNAKIEINPKDFPDKFDYIA